jgi:ion channel
VGILRGLPGFYTAHRYAVLFYTLLTTLAASPLLTALRFSADLLQIFLAFNVLIALLDVPRRGWRMILVAFVAIAAGLRAAPAAAVGSGLATTALVAGSAVGVLAVMATVRFAMRATVIDSEHVYAALSAYLLAGLVFGVLHWAIANAWPGSVGEAAASAATGLSLATAIYYSFVTLATLGYGDVVPKSEVARGLAVFEAVAGQLYIAVMVARLVGAQLQTPGGGGENGRCVR